MATKSTTGTARYIAGWILIGIVGAVMLFAGVAKTSGLLPEENLDKMGVLAEQVLLIGAGALASSVLLLIPRTASIGVLLCSAYWGGAICTHMLQETSYAVPAVLLILTWAGSALRDPRSLWSFHRPARTEQTPPQGEHAATPVGVGEASMR